MVGWLAHQLERHRARRAAVADPSAARDGPWLAAEAVDPDFADALRGDSRRLVWNRAAGSDGTLVRSRNHGRPQRWRWPWWDDQPHTPEVIHRLAPAGAEPPDPLPR